MAIANTGKSETQRAIRFVRSEVAKRIIGYRVRGTSTADLIAEAKKQQKWINDRIDALARAGIPKNGRKASGRRRDRIRLILESSFSPVRVPFRIRGCSRP